MTATAPTAPPRSLSPFRVRVALVALAVGGFAIGTTEFVTMGVLPQIAAGLGVDEPDAARAISAYALGVVIGVPVLSILGARLPRRGLLIALMGGYAVFNLLSGVAVSYGMFVVVRFLDGVPHGAYFGIATLVAARLVPEERRGRAVAGVLLGLSIANVIGVPAATWLGQTLGWRSAYFVTAGLALVTVALVAAVVPRIPADQQQNGRREARVFFTRAQVWLTIAAGAVGFGGLFTIYSYIATTVTAVAGLSSATVPVWLLAFGLGMTVGTWVGGEVARWSVYKSLVLSVAGSIVLMVAFWVVAPFGWWGAPVLFLLTAVNAILVTSLQLRLMDVAGSAVTLGAAMNQASLNIANALGAWLGGAVITLGYGYRAPALIGAVLALLGLIVVLISGALERRRTAPAV